MALLQILKYPDSRLYTVAAPVAQVDDAVRALVDDMAATMYAAPGIGLAATQVNVHKQVIVMDISESKDQLLVLINPEITKWDGYEMGREGCLSVPDYTGNVIRANNIVLQAFDQHGERHEYEMEGFEARAVQHEIDHLDGLLFLDRVVSRRSDIFKRKVYKKPGKQ